MRNYKFKYLDLFAGIGGFHQAMDKIGGKCVGAAEIDSACIETYKTNFSDTPQLGDITNISPSTLPKFDVLCAGFPCQPFSKAGKRLGFEDESRGKLFFKIMDIVKVHTETKFLILENVKNLADCNDYWSIICEELKKNNFIITDKPLILSPSDFGIPQLRERVFILCIHKSIADTKKINNHISFEDLNLKLSGCSDRQAFDILDDKVPQCCFVDKERNRVILAWEEFRRGLHLKTVGYPIWLSAMGIYENNTDVFFDNIKFYEMPKWKQNIYKKNRNLYLENKLFIDKWIKKNDMLSKSKLYQKFEWNCGNDVDNIKHGIVQVRQSGVRVKRPNYFPALVAMNNTPIVWDENYKHFRVLTTKEAARLQSFNEDFIFCGTERQQHKQLGNSVNVEILALLGNALLNLRKD